ncbi:glycoside hydrolase family 43 protein [Aquisphaera insulae]|uniref:glycoside hydrolase family 43 protein n=1 Tax=Aquisphaera insulae TaxID=2712864 RepID=UPI00196A94BB|nr:glycoside hydrolase family 43 protein [Aquisphaera insulae]
MKIFCGPLAVLLGIIPGMQETATLPPVPAHADTAEDDCLLFSYFLGNGEDGLHLATSQDGLTWTPLGGGKSYLAPKVGKSRLMRDPCLLRGHDGTFQLVWTDSWDRRTIGHASSKDLVHWSDQQAIPVMKHEPKALNCWAPEILFDDAKRHYLIFWSTTIPGRFPETEGTGDENYNHRIYATTTTDFKTFTPTRLFYDGGFNVIDATILKANDKSYLIVKDETLKPVKKHLRMAVADTPDGPFVDLSPPFTPSWVEGPSAIRIGDDFLIYFDCYRDGHYGAVRSRDLKHWEDITPRVSFPKGARHGTVLRVPRRILERL